MFRKIMLPLDRSQYAERALKTAAALAAQTDGMLLLLHAIPAPTIDIPEVMNYSIHTPDLPSASYQVGGEAYLEGVADRLRRRYPKLPVQTMLVDGDAAGAILDTAAAEKADLIVMSTHGHTGITRWVLGSVSEKVTHHAPCPVLLVRNGRPIQRVLITLDGSKLAERALAPGLQVAQAFGAAVTLLSVEQARDYAAMSDVANIAAAALAADADRDAYAHEVSDYLTDLARTASKGAQAPAVTTAVRQGDPASAILDYAAEHEIDVIVMSTHGRTGLRRWAYGSVTEKVVRGASCAMFILRPF